VQFPEEFQGAVNRTAQPAPGTILGHGKARSLCHGRGRGAAGRHVPTPNDLRSGHPGQGRVQHGVSSATPRCPNRRATAMIARLQGEAGRKRRLAAARRSEPPAEPERGDAGSGTGPGVQPPPAPAPFRPPARLRLRHRPPASDMTPCISLPGGLCPSSRFVIYGCFHRHGSGCVLRSRRTLCRTNLVHAFATNARNQQGLWRSVTRMASTLASIPLVLAADSFNRVSSTTSSSVRYRGDPRIACAISPRSSLTRSSGHPFSRAPMNDDQVAADLGPAAGAWFTGAHGPHRGPHRASPGPPTTSVPPAGVRGRKGATWGACCRP